MNFIVYKATSPSGKMYIGKTKNLRFRITHHKSVARKFNRTPFQKALNKYQDKILFEELFTAFSEKDALHIEKELIKEFNSFVPNGYNCTLGGEGTSGRVGYWAGKKHTEEQKLQIKNSVIRTKRLNFLKIRSTL